MVVASISAICVAILLFSYLRLCTQLCGITLSRTQVQRQRLFVVDESNADDLSLQFQSCGLELSTLHSLPVTQFEQKSGEEANHTSNTECPVCLVELKEEEWLRQLPNCSHSFHISCIDTWFLNHSNCLLCRSEVQSLELDDCDFSISVQTPLQTLNREYLFRERAAHYRIIRTEILQNSVTRRESDDGN